jgi:hypothetical protein
VVVVVGKILSPFSDTYTRSEVKNNGEEREVVG